MKRFCSKLEAIINPVPHEDNNFNIVPLIWLDSLVNTSQQHVHCQKLVRSSIDHLKTFEDVDKCEEYIRSVSQHERIILIVNARLAQEIIPRIHQLRQVSSIYIYCIDKLPNEQWVQQYKKVGFKLIEIKKKT